MLSIGVPDPSVYAPCTCPLAQIFMLGTSLLLANETVLKNNTAGSAAEQALDLVTTSAGVAMYQLPAPPGSWISGRECFVAREVRRIWAIPW